MEQGKGITADQQHTAELQIAAKFCKGHGLGGEEVYDMTKARRLFEEVVERVKAVPLPSEIQCEDGRPALAASSEVLEEIKHATGELNVALFEGYREHAANELKSAGIDPVLSITIARLITQDVETRKVRVIW